MKADSSVTYRSKLPLVGAAIVALVVLALLPLIVEIYQIQLLT